MNRIVKNFIRKTLRKRGFDIVQFHGTTIGVDPISDIKRFLKKYDNPVLLDVGANTGQTIDRYMIEFPDSIIHSFEPAPETYAQLKKNCARLKNVFTWNYAVGSENGILSFQEHDHSDMSSFLPPNKSLWSKVVKQTDVEVMTMDTFAENNAIDFIHLLKSDTQGFDFEVLKGAKNLMDANKIGLVYFEFIFSEMYFGVPKFNAVFQYLMEKNFEFVTFYEPHYQNDLISWTDVLFINRNFYDKSRNTVH